jgi:hypothetical protein
VVALLPLALGIASVAGTATKAVPKKARPMLLAAGGIMIWIGLDATKKLGVAAWEALVPDVPDAGPVGPPIVTGEPSLIGPASEGTGGVSARIINPLPGGTVDLSWLGNTYEIVLEVTNTTSSSQLATVQLVLSEEEANPWWLGFGAQIVEASDKQLVQSKIEVPANASVQQKLVIDSHLVKGTTYTVTGTVYVKTSAAPMAESSTFHFTTSKW